MMVGGARLMSGGAAAAALVLALVACAGTGAAPSGAGGPAPEAGAPPPLAPSPRPADLGAVERFAWQTVEQLGEAIAQGNAPAFLGKVSNGFYRGYARLDAAVRALVARTASRKVVVAVREVTVDEERVMVRAEWTAALRGGDGAHEAHAGTTTFIFLRSEVALRLLDFRGDPPFGIAGI